MQKWKQISLFSPWTVFTSKLRYFWMQDPIIISLPHDSLDSRHWNMSFFPCWWILAFTASLPFMIRKPKLTQKKQDIIFRCNPTRINILLSDLLTTCQPFAIMIIVVYNMSIIGSGKIVLICDFHLLSSNQKFFPSYEWHQFWRTTSRHNSHVTDYTDS